MSADQVRTAYNQRMSARQAAAAGLRRREVYLSGVRLVLAILAVALLWPVIFARSVSPFWLALPVAAFIAAVLVHDRVIRRRERWERAAVWYEQGLARLDDRWMGAGTPGDEFLDPQHPYARDVDLFGRGSVFELLCTARTVCGRRRLAQWLLAPAPVEVVHARQAAVDEWRAAADLREDFAVLGEAARADLDPERLIAWGELPRCLAPRAVPIVAGVLAASNLAGLVAWAALPEGAGQPWALAALGLSGAVALVWRARVERVLRAVDSPSRELELLSALLARIESQTVHTALLLELHGRLVQSGVTPSRAINRLARTVELRDSRSNMIFAPLAALTFTGTQLACALERWQSTAGRELRGWLDVVAEVEALAALATYAHEHPADPFPRFEAGPARFDGEGVCHPLLPSTRAVGNDVRLGGERQLLLVSGSNMSGKSTLLRSVAVNAILAQAGAPVRARRLELTPLAIGACLRVQDSLQEGTSHFYAEILRLRQIVELAEGGRSLLFLLDEVLHGTNSHDRRVGAEALIRGLVERGAIGLVTTHDLALAAIADALAPRAANVHFVDHIDGGRIAFDYRLRDGVVRKSNALALMRAVGLQV